ncbi:MAG: molybdopterin-dependent oxidoreductase [Dehalococcoidales bacterium]|nr:molybdopterin-dependent oxidoreductase [Dehalococcoidales bacterium]
MEKTGATTAGAEAVEKIIPTFCHGCGAAKPRCAVLCRVKNGRFIGVEGNPDACNNGRRGSASLCAKGHTGPQVVYSPDRLLFPLKRAGERGEGKFQRITWDEALETIAAKLKETRDRYGPESYGVLSPEFWPVLGTLGRRFLNVHGSPNYLHSGICATPRMAAALITIGFNSWSTDDFEKSKLIVNWGANPENSGPNQGVTFSILNALEKGAKLIDIRPMMDPLASKADLWLPVRPGTDCALALSFLNVIIGEKLYDFDFVAEWCHGFDKLADYVRHYSPEWAAGITGLPVDRIRQAARMIGAIKPVFIKTGNGIGDQTTDGTSTIMATSLISAITGNLDIPGGYYSGPPPVGPGLIRINRIPSLGEKAPPGFVEKLVAPETPVWFQKAVHWDGGPTGTYYGGLMSIITGKPYPIRVLQASCTNPLSATRNPKKVAEALKKVDFFFTMDVHRAPHIDYADIVLPACTDYEHSHQIEVKNMAEGTWIGIYNKVVEPPGECRSDWQFYLDLAVKMGYGADFWNGDMDACLREQLEPSGISLEELRSSPRGIFVERNAPPASAEYRRYDRLFKRLPHGKVQCCNELIGGKDDLTGSGTLPYFPVYQGPPEGIAETPRLTEEYPLIISDVHAYRLSHHSYLNDAPYLRELEPYPWLRINPATAQKYGIADGDWVKVESLYGWCRFKAEYFPGISPEVLMTRRGWCQPCQELGLPGYPVFDGGSEVNNLYNTDESLFDRFHSQMPKQTLVKISRIEGE